MGGLVAVVGVTWHERVPAAVPVPSCTLIGELPMSPAAEMTTSLDIEVFGEEIR
jgi:hypothetical protein